MIKDIIMREKTEPSVRCCAVCPMRVLYQKAQRDHAGPINKNRWNVSTKRSAAVFCLHLNYRLPSRVRAEFDPRPEHSDKDDQNDSPS